MECASAEMTYPGKMKTCKGKAVRCPRCEKPLCSKHARNAELLCLSPRTFTGQLSNEGRRYIGWEI